MTGPSADHSARARTPVRSSSAAGRTRSKLISTITSVPPAMGSAPGLAALTASASGQVAGRKKSMTDSTTRSMALGQDKITETGGSGAPLVCAFLQGSADRDHGIGTGRCPRGWPAAVIMVVWLLEQPFRHDHHWLGRAGEGWR